MPSQSKSPKKEAKLVLLPKVERIYRFTVRLIGGPFALKKGQRKPLRVIDIRGEQTLADLHVAIFDAFERYDMHLYEFQIGGRAPMDLRAVRYGLPEGEGENEKEAEAARIDDLHLAIGEIFFYWFDFGDDWMHEIRLDAILTSEGGEHYPRLVKKQGASPPQYPCSEMEENEKDAEEDINLSTPEDIVNPEKVKAAIQFVLRPTRQKTKHALERLVNIFIEAAGFCMEHLNHEYASVCLTLLIFIDQESDLPLDQGTSADWAAALVHVIGFVNFLDDPDSEPFMKLADIAQHFNVSKCVMENRSWKIRKALKIGRLATELCTTSILADNPQAWILENEKGFVFDVRQTPRKVQEQAFAAGLIPWIPADFPDLHKEMMPPSKRQSHKRSAPKKAPKEDPPQGQGSFFNTLPDKRKNKT